MTAITASQPSVVQARPVQQLRSPQGSDVKADTSTSQAAQNDQAVFSAEAKALAAAESDSDATVGPKPESELTPEEKTEAAQLKARDAEVRAHEQAHLSALGGEGGSVNYQYTTGPDGRRYVTGGEVPISIGEATGGPEATIAKAQTIARAATAPAQPSSADHAARGKALQLEAKARQELREQEEDGETAPVDGATTEQGLIDGAASVQDANESPEQAGETDENGRTKPTESALNQPAS